MGHNVNVEREYRLLQQRMDHNVCAVPESPAILGILRILYSPEDAAFAARLPIKPTRIEKLVPKFEMPADELLGKLDDLAGNREAARRAYSRGLELCRRDADPGCISSAERLLQHGYTGTN
ncbi:MAG: hypothetical protein NTU83_08620, partial [Candidatus Hydrogenedentes bacterium]|nr:hypothetical protein [Candidatus Hydrogenedentota bacterium]